MEFYRLEKGGYVFYARSIFDKKEKFYQILIGSKKRPSCMLYIIYKNNPTAILQGISYDDRCASNKPMPKKIGTRDMMLVSMYFIKNIFPWIKIIELTDNSSFNCDNKIILTSIMSFLLHGKSWYEKYFNANPENIRIYNEYKNKYMLNPKLLSFEEIWKLLKYDKQLNKETIKNMYDNSITYIDFINKIYKEYNCNPFITITNNNNLLTVLNVPFDILTNEWFIKVDSITFENCIIERQNIDDFPNMNWDKIASVSQQKWLGGK